VLGGHFGSQIIVVKIEVVHHKLKGVSAKAQEKWIKKSAAAAVDVVILIGLLVSLSVTAWTQGVHSWPIAGLKASVSLGFLAL
jgi:NADH:ubiquinone oxidoreductase subunit 6 (subunit J)